VTPLLAQGEEQPPATVESSLPPPEAPAVDEAEMERRYRQQNSGAGYRKNNQDGLLFAMGLYL